MLPEVAQHDTRGTCPNAAIAMSAARKRLTIVYGVPWFGNCGMQYRHRDGPLAEGLGIWYIHPYGTSSHDTRKYGDARGSDRPGA